MKESITRAMELTDASKKVLKIFDGKGFTYAEIESVLINTLNTLDAINTTPYDTVSNVQDSDADGKNVTEKENSGTEPEPDFS